jgi:hypothetical protein
MMNCNAPENQTNRRILLFACAAALDMASTASLAQLAHAYQLTPPPVPSNIQVPAGNKAFLKGHALGTQNYICLPLPSGTGFAWTFFAPQATLFNHKKQVITHFLSPDLRPIAPEVAGTPRATWQHSRDTSTVWAFATPATTSSDPDFVAPGAIPWLLLQVVGAKDGPTGGHKLTATTFIQRLKTSGGLAPPSTDCTQSTIGAKALVPYTADYFFYKAAKSK